MVCLFSFCFLSVPFYPVQDWFPQNEFLFDFWALMCQFSFCCWILSDPEAGYSWINVAVNHSCLSEFFGAEIENSLIVWCQSLGIFLTMAKWCCSLPPCPLHAPFCHQLQRVQPLPSLGSNLSISAVKCEGCSGRKEVLAESRNQTNSSAFPLHCSNALGAAAAGRWSCPVTHEGRFWPSLPSLFS